MQKSLVIIGLLLLLVSFAPGKTAPPFFKHIDITFTSPEGCLFHVVGDATFNLFKLKLTRFTGTITISGPGGCPRGTYQISYSSFQVAGEDLDPSQKEGIMKMEFNTDEICNISSVSFLPVDGSRETQIACESVNSKEGLKVALIEEIKEGSCK